MRLPLMACMGFSAGSIAGLVVGGNKELLDLILIVVHASLFGFMLALFWVDRVAEEIRKEEGK